MYSDRAEREAAYAERKNDMVKWIAPVQANRQAETLDFTPSVSVPNTLSLIPFFDALLSMKLGVYVIFYVDHPWSLIYRNAVSQQTPGQRG